jgi:hypothetical protein
MIQDKNYESDFDKEIKRVERRLIKHEMPTYCKFHAGAVRIRAAQLVSKVVVT